MTFNVKCLKKIKIQTNFREKNSGKHKRNLTGIKSHLKTHKSYKTPFYGNCLTSNSDFPHTRLNPQQVPTARQSQCSPYQVGTSFGTVIFAYATDVHFYLFSESVI